MVNSFTILRFTIYNLFDNLAIELFLRASRMENKWYIVHGQIVHHIYSSLNASTGFFRQMFHAGMAMPMETVVRMMR